MSTPRHVAALLLAVLACGEPDAPAADAGDGPAAPGPGDAAGSVDLPPGTDVWVATLAREGGALRLGAPQNVTRRAGYDNQPHFLPDGSGLWYTRTDEAGQADIWRYDFAGTRHTNVTASAPESEYSATALPDGSGFSAIRVEADSTQRLWRFDADGGGARVLLPDIAPVGYHAWSGERTLVLFVLGSPATLQVADVETGRASTVAEDIGRSLQPIPGGTDVSYVQRVGDETEIRRLDPGAGRSSLLTRGVDGGDDHAWTPDGTLLQGAGGRLMAWRPGSDGWTEVADLGGLGLVLTRIAVSPDGARVALVAEPAGTREGAGG